MYQKQLVNFITAYPLCKYWVLICFHIIGDFLLQTDFMARGKSKQYWKDLREKRKKSDDMDKIPPVLPDRDWIMPLLAHCFLWSCCVHYPIIISSNTHPLIIALSIGSHTLIHAFIDHGKTNLHLYTIFGDQIFHILQLLLLVFM